MIKSSKPKLQTKLQGLIADLEQTKIDCQEERF